MIKAGFAETDITPLPGMSCCSFAQPKLELIKTKCSVTAAVFSDGQKTVAVAGVDVPALNRSVYNSALAALAKRCRVDMLLCAASHTHEGGPSINFRPGNEELFQKIEDLSPEVRALGIDENVRMAPDEQIGDPELNRQYPTILANAIADAVAAACKRMTPVRLILGKAPVEDVAYNRRIRMKDGFVVTHPGSLNPDSVDYAGPVDKELTALAAVDDNGRIQGVVFNFACHGTVDMGKEFSADYPYYARETIRKMLGADVVPVFLNGPCGDVTQIDNLSPKPWRLGGDWAKILGQRVGFAAVDAISNGKPEVFEKIVLRSEELVLTYRQPGPQEYAAALKKANVLPDPKNFSYPRWWAMGKIILKWLGKYEPDIRAELNVAQLGNLVLCALPVETFCETGLKIKAASSFPFTMIAELTNDWLGYMPTADVFGPQGGGYEGEFKSGSYLEETAEEKVRTKLLQMLSDLKPEKEIVEEKAVPTKAGGGWWKWHNEKYGDFVDKTGEWDVKT